MVVFPILTDTSLSSTTVLDASIPYSRQQNQLLDLGDLSWSLAPTFQDVNCGEPQRIRGEILPNPLAGLCLSFLTVRSNSIGPARLSAPMGIAPMQSLTQVILSAQGTGSLNCELRGALHAAVHLRQTSTSLSYLKKLRTRFCTHFCSGEPDVTTEPMPSVKIFAV
jgi:hypothetical protein